VFSDPNSPRALTKRYLRCHSLSLRGVACVVSSITSVSDRLFTAPGKGALSAIGQN